MVDEQGGREQERSGRQARTARPAGTGRPKGKPATGGRSRAPRLREKQLQRERRIKARQRREKLTLVAAIVLVSAAAFGSFSLYRSQAFEIRQVDIHGNERLAEDAVLALAALPEGSTLLRVDPADIERRLKGDPWVAEATVTRRLPDRLVLEIVERRPVALLDMGGASLWLVSSEGMVLGERSLEETAALPVIRDLPVSELRPGQPIAAEELENALGILRGLSDQLRGRLRAISAPTIDKTALYTVDDVEVFVGSVEDIERKDLVARRIMEEQAGTVVYINVRTVDRPTWRGLESVDR